jgi:hypothetical protein
VSQTGLAAWDSHWPAAMTAATMKNNDFIWNDLQGMMKKSKGKWATDETRISLL